MIRMKPKDRSSPLRLDDVVKPGPLCGITIYGGMICIRIL